MDQGVAWRDGDLLVVSRHAPIPPRCVLCGTPSDRTLDTRILWNARHGPLSWLKILDTQFPLCDAHVSARRRWLATCAVLAVTFYLLAFAALLAVLGAGYNAALLLVPLVALLALTIEGDRGRRHSLRVVRLDGEYAWLAGAGDGLLQELPTFSSR